MYFLLTRLVQMEFPVSWFFIKTSLIILLPAIIILYYIIILLFCSSKSPKLPTRLFLFSCGISHRLSAFPTGSSQNLYWITSSFSQYMPCPVGLQETLERPFRPGLASHPLALLYAVFQAPFIGGREKVQLTI